ncbi:MAG: ISAs1 family transposase [Beijerinckiaceae bacterium]
MRIWRILATSNAGKHDLIEIVLIALCTVMCGGETACDMAMFAREKEAFLREFLKLENGPPSHDTPELPKGSRVFRLLDPEEFRLCFEKFMFKFAQACGGVIAIDGKVLRRCFDKASALSPLHMVSAWGCDRQTVLAQIAIEAKSNEITAVPKLLKLLTLKDAIATVDAVNCQRAIAKARSSIKAATTPSRSRGNQGTLHDDVKLFLDDPRTKPATQDTTVQAGHGRIETRTVSISTGIGWLQEQHHWPGLQAAGKVARIRETGDKISTEIAYYLFSWPVEAPRANEVVRQHWGVENRLHWRLDVTMNEDAARNRLGNGPHNLAILRHMVLNAMSRDKSKISLRGKFKKAAWNEQYLRERLANS